MKFEYDSSNNGWMCYTCDKCQVEQNGHGPFHEGDCSLREGGLDSMTCHVGDGILWKIGMDGSYDQSNGEEKVRGLFLKFDDLPPILKHRVRKLVPKNTRA